MNKVKTNISDLLIIEPNEFCDDRGFFFESFNQNKFQELTGLKCNFVQDNHSHSKKNVLRGLHYQLSPFDQGKLVRVVQGEVFDVAVDIRKRSTTFGKWFGITLSQENKRQLWIPPGFAHGFLVLSDSAEFLYKTTNYYSREHERCLIWNDSSLGITWPLNSMPIISEKDGMGADFQSYIDSNIGFL